MRAPSPFPYKSDKVVPWRYGVQGSDGRQDASVMRIRASMPTAKVMNISNMSGVTHIGHIFSPLKLPTKSNDKGKVKEDVVERGKVGLVTYNGTPLEKPTKEEDSLGKKDISTEEAMEFLRIIQ